MILAYIFSTLLDVHSSCMSISRGSHEVLLPFRTCKSISLSQIVIVPSVTLYDFKYLSSHKKLRKIILISAIASHSIAAIKNYENSHSR